MTITRRFLIAPALAVSVAALSIAGCGDKSTTATAGTKAAVPAGVDTVIDIHKSPVGEILVGADGRTLYLFEKDSATESMCSADCASVWPPLRSDGKPQAGAGASDADIGTITRSDGAPQVTYNDHPLYFYTGDTGPGDTNGQGLKQFGAKWYVVSPKGTAIETGNPGSSGGGSGGTY